MKRDQFLRMLEERCASENRAFKVRKSEGKGSHYRVYVDNKKTIVKSGEISPIYMQIIYKQLGLK